MIGYFFLPEKPITFRHFAILAMLVLACAAMVYFFLLSDTEVTKETKATLQEPVVYQAEKVGNEIYKISR